MKITELIDQLQSILAAHGDLDVEVWPYSGQQIPTSVTRDTDPRPQARLPRHALRSLQTVRPIGGRGMKRYEERTETVKRQVVVEIRCDLCGRVEASQSPWDIAETEVRMRIGTQYPEGGSGLETSFDICSECFSQKLIPWVCSHGGIPTVKEWET